MAKDEELKEAHTRQFVEYHTLGPDFECWCRSERELLAVSKIDQLLYSAKQYLTRDICGACSRVVSCEWRRPQSIGQLVDVIHLKTPGACGRAKTKSASSLICNKCETFLHFPKEMQEQKIEEVPHFVECARIADELFFTSLEVAQLTPGQLLGIKGIDRLLFAVKHLHDTEDPILKVQCGTNWDLCHIRMRQKLANTVVELVENVFPFAEAKTINRLSNLLLLNIMSKITPPKPRDPCMGGVRLPPPIPDYQPRRILSRPPSYKSEPS